MNRSTRTAIVVSLAVVLAGAATYLVYKMIQSRPLKEVEVAHTFAVVCEELPDERRHEPLSLRTK